jgi:hypothetical protein
MNTPKERPILFSAPMARAILAGTKTQTRHIIKPQPDITEEWIEKNDQWSAGLTLSQMVDAAWQSGFVDVRCPYGEPGDRLWVRETWCLDDPEYAPQTPPTPRPMKGNRFAWYAATEPDVEGEDNKSPWKPSIHMPRWASRLLLEVVSVRVDRLQEITEKDAIAEGIAKHTEPPRLRGWWAGPEGNGYLSAKDAYRALWDSINGKRSPWADSPWVWVVEFKKIEVQP